MFVIQSRCLQVDIHCFCVLEKFNRSRLLPIHILPTLNQLLGGERALIIMPMAGDHSGSVASEPLYSPVDISDPHTFLA